jgi:Mg-chelatase subunit ChlD
MLPEMDRGNDALLAEATGDYDSDVIGQEIEDFFSTYIRPMRSKEAFSTVEVEVEVTQPPDGSTTEDTCITVVGTASAVGGSSIDILLVLDSSGSLSWNDPSDFREQAAVALINNMNPAADLRIGVIDFDGGCSLVSPLTLIGDDNGASAIAAVQAMDQFGGTAIDCGINLAVNTFLGSGRAGASWTVILFSDGESSAAPAMAAANYAFANGVTINTVFLGGTGSTLMNNIAGTTGGFYLATSDPQDLPDAFGSGPVTGIAQVTVNGIIASLSAGTFEADLCLDCGLNEIIAVATATDTAGTQGSDTVYVTRECILGFFTGGGSIDYGTGMPSAALRAPGPKSFFTFGFNAGNVGFGPDLKGSLQVTDHSSKMKIHGYTVDTFSIADHTATWTGDCRVNNMDGYTYWAEATDYDEPGRGIDEFYVKVWNPGGMLVYDQGGVLDGGNIQEHLEDALTFFH